VKRWLDARRGNRSGLERRVIGRPITLKIGLRDGIIEYQDEKKGTW
jgi:hypothetical protein